MPFRYVENQLSVLLGAHVASRRKMLDFGGEYVEGVVHEWLRTSGGEDPEWSDEMSSYFRGQIVAVALTGKLGKNQVSPFETGQDAAAYLTRLGAADPPRPENLKGKALATYKADALRSAYLKYLDSRIDDLAKVSGVDDLRSLADMQADFIELIRRAALLKAQTGNSRDSTSLDDEISHDNTSLDGEVTNALISLYLTAHLAWGPPSVSPMEELKSIDRSQTTSDRNGPALGLAVDLLRRAAATDPSTISPDEPPLIIVTARAFQDISDAPGAIRLGWYNATTTALARGWRMIHTVRRRRDGSDLKPIEHAELISSLFTDLKTTGALEFVVDVVDTAPDLVAVQGVGVVQLFPSDARIERQRLSITRSARDGEYGRIKSELRDDISFFYPITSAPDLGQSNKADRRAAQHLFERAEAWTRPYRSDRLVTRHDLPVDGGIPSAEFVALDHQMAIAELASDTSRYTIKSGGPLMSTMPDHLRDAYFDQWLEEHEGNSQAQERIKQLADFNRMRYNAMRASCEAGVQYRDLYTWTSLRRYVSEDPEPDLRPYGGSTLSIDQRREHVEHLVELMSIDGTGYSLRMAEDAILPPGMSRTWMILTHDEAAPINGEAFFVASVLDPTTLGQSSRRRLARLRDSALARRDSMTYFLGLHKSLWDRIDSDHEATVAGLRGLVEN